MDQIFLRFGFSMPSFGTPLYQTEEGQQILQNALQQQQYFQPVTNQVPSPTPLGGLSPTLRLQIGNAVSIPHTIYVTTPQTPQHTMTSPMVNLGESEAGGTTPTIEVPSIPSPMTPLTPHSVDPGIEPQLQNILSTINLNCQLDLKK
ncbi:hypothetical protein GWI33_008162 [Rhynchophorus ferrugineus]|uniref:Uncharacterized protein n=1 Tax=Rhynchophorus ferrugineus TaxID=354439 RepID=A0A834IGK8_RHYFE|nr:hypothetical protein GWI33_008162 [Rhynchophorus ferrugineus]